MSSVYLFVCFGFGFVSGLLITKYLQKEATQLRWPKEYFNYTFTEGNAHFKLSRKRSYFGLTDISVLFFLVRQMAKA